MSALTAAEQKPQIMAATKTDGETGAELTAGCSYQMLGVDGSNKNDCRWREKQPAKSWRTDYRLRRCLHRLPCYGEDARQDEAMRDSLRKALAPAPLHIVNDVEVGWAGALECQPGIHIVAGTGSIAFAKDESGHAARSGGWNEFFGERRLLLLDRQRSHDLFTKEADGRAAKGALYEIVRQELRLADDMDFIDLVIREYAPYRDKVAAFQRFAAQAAQAGDAEAIALYERAAHELALMVQALKRELRFPDGTKVSYSGGLFQTGDLFWRR